MKEFFNKIIHMPTDLAIILAVALIIIILCFMPWPRRKREEDIQYYCIEEDITPKIKPMIQVKVDGVESFRAELEKAAAAADEFRKAIAGEAKETPSTEAVEDEQSKDLFSFTEADACRPIDQPDIAEDDAQEEARSHLGYEAHRLEAPASAGNWNLPADAMVYTGPTGILPGSKPKLTRDEALRAANANKATEGKVRADNAAFDLLNNLAFDDVAAKNRIKPDTLRKLLAKHGYTRRGLRKSGAA